MWLNACEVASLLQVTSRSVRRLISRYVSRLVPNPNGGRPKYEIALESLPQEAQDRYWAEIREQKEAARSRRGRPSAATLSKRKVAEAAAAQEVQANIAYEEAPSWQKLIVDHRIHAVLQTKGMGRADKADWLKCHGYTESIDSLYRWARAYREGGKNALFAQYGTNRNSSCIPNDVFEVWKNAYCQEGGVSIRAAYLVAKGYAVVNYGEDCFLPTPEAFYYRLKRENNASEIFYVRNGYAAWNKRFAATITRDYSKITCGQAVFSDHMQLDLMVKMADGSICRPWLTAWSDFKSRKIVGWCLHPEAPNSDHIFQSFFDLATKFGLPETVYIDNGKDYRCKDFTGGRRVVRLDLDENRTSSLMADLNIEVRFAIPYGAQTKNIERRFRDFHGYFEKLLPGYTGTNTVKRPEGLKEEIKSDKLLTYEQASTLLDDFIEKIINRLPFGRRAIFANKCPDEVWQNDKPILRQSSKNSLKLLCMRTSGLLPVTRSGVLDPVLGATYWAEEFTELRGKKVYLRRDIKAFQTAWVFGEDDQLICQATLTEKIHPLASDDVSKADLKEAIARKRHDHKVAAKLAKSRKPLDADKQSMYLQAGIAAINRQRGFIDEQPEGNVIAVQSTPLDVPARQIAELREGTTGQRITLPPPLPAPAKRKLFLTKTAKKHNLS